MIRLPTRLTLRRLAAVPIVVGVTFAFGSWAHAPWQVSALNAGLFVLPVFVTGPTITRWLVFYFVAGIRVGLVHPWVTPRCRPAAVSRSPNLPSMVPHADGNSSTQ